MLQPYDTPKSTVFRPVAVTENVNEALCEELYGLREQRMEGTVPQAKARLQFSASTYRTLSEYIVGLLHEL